MDGFARIIATATAVPEEKVSNEAIIAAYGHQVADTAVHQLFGISERRVAGPGVVDSDLLLLAAQRCLAQANLPAAQLSKLIVTKFLGDRVLPMTAALLQRKLDCDVAIQAFDIDGGIHSFLQALDVAVCAIGCGDGPILVVSGGVNNRLVSRTDPRLAFLFGDGAAAVLVAPSPKRHILAGYSFSNYGYADLARGFSIRECAPEDLHDGKKYDALFELYWQKSWKLWKTFVLEAMAETVRRLLKDAGKNLNDVDHFLVTENHHRLWTAIIEHLGIDIQRTLSIVSRYGNTMSAMLPMLLDEAIRTGRVQPGSVVMLLSVGEGISGGGTLLIL